MDPKQDKEENIVDTLCYSGKVVVWVIILLSNKRDKVMRCPTIWMTPKVSMSRERSQTENNIYCESHSYKMLENASNSIVTEGRTVVAWR